jgi:hypothetical protein
VTQGFIYALANRIACLATRILPPPLKSWGSALEAELTVIPSPLAALAFAISGLEFAIRSAIAAKLAPNPMPSSGEPSMSSLAELHHRPRQLVITCAIAALGLGFAYMTMAGAPQRYLIINGLALGIGLALVALLSTLSRVIRLQPGTICLLLGGILLWLGQIGTPLNGAVRWVNIAGLGIQPSLILVPLTVMCFAVARDGRGLAGIVLTGAALALQPDRAMAGALLAGTLSLALFKPEPRTLVALATSLIAFAITMLQPDLQPAMPYVDQIVHTSFFVHPLAGAAVNGGLLILLVPAIAALRGRTQAHQLLAVFAAIWLAVIIAAALGNYPTPLVGYSGSAVIGYVLATIALPANLEAAATGHDDSHGDISNQNGGTPFARMGA